MSTTNPQHAAMLKRRDQKVKSHLEQFAPVWLIDQKITDEDEAIQFNVLFQHNLYGWVNRRYRYDSFNDVLYHIGQTLMKEEDALPITEGNAYLTVMVGDVPNAYGG